MMRRPPSFEKRRFPELRDELMARARAWLDEWKPRSVRADFGAAVLEIAARLEAEVTQRLDRVPEKSRRGFFQWLGVRGRAGLAARVPVAFKMGLGAEPIAAPRGVRLQALSDPNPITFESDTDLQLVAAKLADVVGADPTQDVFTRPPKALLRGAPPPAVPNDWLVKSLARVGATQIQLAPELGFEEEGVVVETETGRRQYRVEGAKEGIVTIQPPLDAELPAEERVRRVESFAPFEGEPTSRNRQEHALYLGSEAGLDIATPAVIEIDGGAGLGSDGTWEYWGKSEKSPEPTWQAFEPMPADGRLFLSKGKGAIEPKEVGGRQSRWVRLRRKGRVTESAQASNLAFRVNCQDGEASGTLDDRIRQVAQDSVSFEALANTAPLVVDRAFYPLGRDPRIFDAFHLGTKEAFSKPGARVTIDIHVDDALSSPLAGVMAGGEKGNGLAVAVGGDGKLHKLRWTGTGSLAFLAPSRPSSTPSVTLTKGLRPAVLADGGRVYVTAAAGADVWQWTPPTDASAEVWTNLGRPTRTPAESPIESAGDTVLVRSADASATLVYAVFDGRLYWRNVASGDWTEVPIMDAGTAVLVARLVPVVDVDRENVRVEDRIVVVSREGHLYRRQGAEWPRVKLPPAVDPRVYLLVLEIDRGVVCIAALMPQGDAARGEVVAFDFGEKPKVMSAGPALFGNAFAFGRRDDALIVLFLAGSPGMTKLAAWNPLMAGGVSFLPTPAGAEFAGVPVRIDGRLLIPESRGDVLAFVLQTTTQVDVGISVAVIVSKRADLGPTRFWLIDFSPRARVNTKIRVATTRVAFDDRDEQALELPASTETSSDAVAVRIYHALPDDVDRVGTRDKDDDKLLILADGDVDTSTELFFYVVAEGRDPRILAVETIVDGIATMKNALPGEAEQQVHYRRVVRIDGIDEAPVLPMLDTKTTSPARLRDAVLEFPAAYTPRRQRVGATSLAENRVVLGEAWSKTPGDDDVKIEFRGEVLESFKRVEPPRGRNPDLSWEYWNGSGWWRIEGLDDLTGNLVQSERVTFTVPTDLVQTDVAGHGNYWIRARLVGGDYGEETVSVEDDTTGKKHTVVRNRDNVHPPYIVTLKIHYAVCTPVVPEYVLAQDNGWYRDQTEANTTPGAVVECFVPLSVALAHMTAEEAVVSSTQPVVSAAAECVPCGPRAWVDEASATPALVDDGGRALYLCFDAELAGTPINLLFVAEDRDFADAFPLRVEALVDDRFVRILARDGTRGLSETGILSITLDVTPRRRQLFGTDGYWLRVRPEEHFDASKWRPQIYGVYVNAVWATAAETQELELLGSSDGRPSLTTMLTRKPVLADAPPALRASDRRTAGDGLELRVRERLGEEEVAELRRTDLALVDDAIPNRPGQWVRWAQVVDLADAAATDRVYTLEEASGRIVFGDGVHGRVPPIGRDAILAVHYRQGGGRTGNSIKAWDEMNLTTSLLGVERVLVPLGAAGGADPQDAATTIRFAPANLAMQERAVTLRDFESLALQFAPDVAQARALATANGIRLVVVARGERATPSHELIRALGNHLLASASPMLAAPDGLRVVPPRLVSFHAEVFLAVDAIEHTGAVGREARDRIRTLLNAASGGHDGLGWRLGAVPAEEDVAAVLADVAHLERVDSIALARVEADGSRRPLTGPLRADEMLLLAPDGVQVRFVSNAPGVAA